MYICKDKEGKILDLPVAFMVLFCKQSEILNELIKELSYLHISIS